MANTMHKCCQQHFIRKSVDVHAHIESFHGSLCACNLWDLLLPSLLLLLLVCAAAALSFAVLCAAV
jgi:hypothetical protein